MAKAMENPLSKPDIQQKYKEYLDYEADELTTRTGANGPLELCYGSWQEMVESFAVRLECSALEMWGRKGWKKLLPDWNDTYIVYTKDLKQRMQ